MAKEVGSGGGEVAKRSQKGTWDAVFGALHVVVGGAARDQNQATAVITNQLLETLDVSRPPFECRLEESFFFCSNLR